VNNDDEQPSAFLDLIDPVEDSRPYAAVSHPATLVGAVAELRQVAASATPAAEAAAQLLARLAAHGVAGADPDSWWALREVSDARPVRPAGTTVTVSPSKLEVFDQCALRWLLVTHGGDRSMGPAAGVGSLIHAIAAEFPDGAPLAELTAALDARWGELGLGSGWVGERERRRAHDMLRRLVDYWARAAETGWSRRGAEAPVDVTVGPARIFGTVDRVETDSAGRIRLIDYKTGAQVPTKVAEHPQLAAYQLAALAEGETPVGAALVRLGAKAPKDNKPLVQDPLAGESLTWATDLVESTAVKMIGSSYAVSAGDHCRFCPVTASCPVNPEGGEL